MEGPLLQVEQDRTTEPLLRYLGSSFYQALFPEGIGPLLDRRVGLGRWPVLDVATRVFAARFYGTLVQHGQVDYAISAARSRIAQEVGPGRRDWAAPAPAMQTRDGLLSESA